MDEWIIRNEGGIRFDVRLTPNAGANALGDVVRDAQGKSHLKARVTAIPEKNKANKALVALIAKALGVAKGQVEICAGHTSRVKTIDVSGDALSLAESLKAIAGKEAET